MCILESFCFQTLFCFCFTSRREFTYGVNKSRKGYKESKIIECSDSRGPDPVMLDSIWLKAATVGSAWAALEIVLGSFLHNLRVPMTGTVLAACGIAILTASQMIWKEKGLIWRAGVICAVMKSISPSAVIFGPMIGIIAEAFVIQAAVMVLGQNRLGLIVGGMFALLEPVLHRIGSLIVEYGLNIGILYIRLYEFAARSFHVENFSPFDLVFAYILVNILIGAIAVIVGLSIAKQTLVLQKTAVSSSGINTSLRLPTVSKSITYRGVFLILHISVMVVGFIALRTIPAWQSTLLISTYSAFCLWNYPNIRKTFRRPKLWIELLVVGMLASLLLGNLTGKETGWSWRGMETGLQMMVRAVLVVVAFASIGTELRNPRILDWFMKRKLGTLSAAINLAFQALPTMMSALGEQKHVIRHPVKSIAHVLAAGVCWFNELSVPRIGRLRIFIVTGKQGIGKTTHLMELSASLQSMGMRIGGILAPCVLVAGQRVGYDIISITTGERKVLCRADGIQSDLTVGNFHFVRDTIKFGEKVISEDSVSGLEAMFIDEIGPLELSGRGWSSSLTRLFDVFTGIVILSVRPELISQVEAHWKFTSSAIWQADQTTIENMVCAVNKLK